MSWLRVSLPRAEQPEWWVGDGALGCAASHIEIYRQISQGGSKVQSSSRTMHSLKTTSPRVRRWRLRTSPLRPRCSRLAGCSSVRTPRRRVAYAGKAIARVGTTRPARLPAVQMGVALLLVELRVRVAAPS